MKKQSNTHIIIVTYNGMKWLPHTLASIPIHYPVILIDNASSDATCEFIKREYPQHTLLQEKENLGFGQANNKGISWAITQGAQAVFLLNQDAYVTPNTVTGLESVAQNLSDFGILSPVHYNGKGDALDHQFSKYMAYDRQPEFYGDAIAQRLKEVYEVPFVNAAAWYLPKETLETIGGFDPIFFHYGEDDNYVQRVRYHNLKVGVVPQSILYHDREDRLQQKPGAFSPAYFKRAENRYKVRLANINIQDIAPLLEQEVSKLSKNALKSIIRFDFNRARGYRKEKTLLGGWINEIRNSRSQNKTVGNHYL